MQRLVDSLRSLEHSSRLLEPDARQRDSVLKQIADHAQQYMQDIPTAPTYRPEADGPSRIYASPISEDGMEMGSALELLRTSVDQVGINLSSGRYLGYIPGGGLFHSALGDFLAALTNRYAGLFFVSPGAVRIENMLVAWMASELGLPGTAGGTLTSGGSIANLIAVLAARDTHGISARNHSEPVVYLTDQTHHCSEKALHICGLGTQVCRRIRTDGRYRMDAADLERAILEDKAQGRRPWLVIASAGTTNTGSVDPLPEISAIAKSNGMWFHVDAAYGGFFALCPEGRTALKGIEAADSIALDAHKSLFLPYGLGTILVRDRRHLLQTFSAQADYIVNTLDDNAELSPADMSPELTRHFRGLRLWLPLKALGLKPFRAALSEKIQLARYFHERLSKEEGFELGPYPDLSVVTYRYVPKQGGVDEFNERLLKEIQREGHIFVSSTKLNGNVVLRAAILSHRTHMDEIDEALRVLTKKARDLQVM